MIKEFGKGLDPLVPGEYRLGDTRHTISDVSRLEALGWQPTVPVEQNVHEYVEWMRQQRTTDEFLKEADRVMRQQGVVRRAKRPLTTDH
jgi:dTDP-D-glucose 4,6-dehydratase